MAARLSPRNGVRRSRSSVALAAVAGLTFAAVPALGTGYVSGTVYNDRNANGVREAGTVYGHGGSAIENGASGVTVTAYDPAGAAVASAVTNYQGAYNLTIPVFSPYRIEFTSLPTGFRAGLHGRDSGTAVQFVPDGSASNVSLGLVAPDQYFTLICTLAPIEVGNRVWHDGNANGIQDADERAIAGVTITITAPDGTTRSTVTDARGEYYFSVAPGTRYSVQMPADQAALAGYVPTIADAGHNREIDSNGYPNSDGSWVWAIVDTNGPGDSDHSLDFGFVDKAAPANPSYEFIKEVKEPATGQWIDADAIAGSAGSNDPTPAVLFAGETAEYRMTVRNTGNVALTGSRVVDAGCGVDQVIALIPAGESRSVFCGKVALADRINTASASGVTPEGNKSALAARTENAAVRVLAASYTILKEVQDPATGQWLDADATQGSPGANAGGAALIATGGTAKYRITVANTGQTELVNAHVIDPWCGLDQTIASIGIAGLAILTCEKAGITADKVNTATVKQVFPKMPAGRTSSHALAAKSEDAAVKVRASGVAGDGQVPVGTKPKAAPGAPIITITKVGAKRAKVGQIVNYTITVRLAKGRSVAKSVKITDLIPAGTSVARPDALRRTGASIARGSVSWQLGNLAAGTTRSVKLALRMNGNDAMSVTNVAVVTATNAPRATARTTTKLVAKVQILEPKVTG